MGPLWGGRLSQRLCPTTRYPANCGQRWFQKPACESWSLWFRGHRTSTMGNALWNCGWGSANKIWSLLEKLCSAYVLLRMCCVCVCWPGFAFLMLSAIKMSVPWLAAQPIATAADLLRRQQKSLRLLWPSDERLFAIDLVDAIPRCCYAGTYSADRHSTCLTRPDCATKKAGASIACNQMKMWLFGIFIDVTYAGCIQTLIQGDCWWH